MRRAGSAAVRIWVVGATGFLGSELVRLARDGGWDVDTARVEVRDPDAVGAHLVSTRADVVVNCAYRQDPPDAWSTNVDGAEVVASATRGVGARLIHMSTDVVFDGRTRGRYREDAAPTPITDYGRSKAEAERRVAAADPEALIVRTSLIVGGPGHAPSKHELVAHDPAMTFFTNEIRSPIQVGDLAGALLELARLDVCGPLHVAGADDVSRAELAALVARAEVAKAEAPPTRPLNCALDSAKAQAMIRTHLRGVRSVLA